MDDAGGSPALMLAFFERGVRIGMYSILVFAHGVAPLAGNTNIDLKATVSSNVKVPKQGSKLV